MRIISCLPAGTAWLQVVGAEEDIVGRSDAFIHPPGRPANTLVHVPVVAAAGQLDFSLMRRLQPDLVIASESQAAHLSAAMPGTEILAVAPRTFKQAADAGLRIAHRAGKMAQGMRFIADQEYRLKLLRDKLGLAKSTPTIRLRSVVLFDVGDSPRAGGLWMPDVVELAGGRPLFAVPGRPSIPVSEEDLVAAAPDVIVLLVESGDPQAVGGPHATGEVPPELPRLFETRMVSLDAAYFLHPGPNLYEAVHLLSRVLHPETT